MIENVDILELLDRYNLLLKEYVELSIELSGKLEKFGRIRNELQILTVEFKKRGVEPKDPQELIEFFENKVKETEEDAKKEHNDQGHTESEQDIK